MPGGLVRVLAGEFKDPQANGVKGFESQYVKTTAYDVSLEAGQEITIPSKEGETVFVFTLVNGLLVGEESIPPKTAALFSDGDAITVKAGPEGSRFTYYAAMPLGETVAWGGPIVMNTEEELQQAFAELEDGSFIKDEVYI